MPSAIFASDLLAGQVVIVSGGGSGLGYATARELCACGATVAICGRDQDSLEAAASQCEAGRCEPLVCDIREPQECERLVTEVLSRHGRIDTLVNNAGGQFMAPAEQISPNGFHAVVRLNLEGTWHLTQAAARAAMIPARDGKIINITLSPHGGLPGMTHSAAARAAVETMTRSLSIEWARFNIRVNAVAAGHMDTEALAKYPQPVRDNLAGSVPLGRLGSAQEHAWLVTYIASPAADYMSGSVVTLDGARDNWLGQWPPAAQQDAEGNPVQERRPGA